MKTVPNQKIRCYFKANLQKGAVFYEHEQAQGGTEQMRELEQHQDHCRGSWLWQHQDS